MVAKKAKTKTAKAKTKTVGKKLATDLSIDKGFSIGNTPITISVKQGEEKLGRLKISKANIEWLPRFRKKMGKIRWNKFAKMMEQFAEEKKAKKKKKKKKAKK